MRSDETSYRKLLLFCVALLSLTIVFQLLYASPVLKQIRWLILFHNILLYRVFLVIFKMPFNGIRSNVIREAEHEDAPQSPICSLIPWFKLQVKQKRFMMSTRNMAVIPDTRVQDVVHNPKNLMTHDQLYVQICQLRRELLRQRQVEEELRDLNRQLQALNASKDMFFSIIAHDLRGPFTGLVDLTEVMAEDIELYSKDHIKNVLHRLHNSSKHIYSLLTNLLTWSRLQHDMIEYRPEDARLDGIISYVVSLFTVSAEHKQITFSSQVPEGLMVYADQNMLHTIIRNLLSNALKFTVIRGTITISARAVDDAVEIVVADTGIGMSQDEVDKLFRIEAKCSRVGTAGEEGTGMGLILCQELVRKNRGSIRVESAPGHGTTFTLRFPGAPSRQERSFAATDP